MSVQATGVPRARRFEGALPAAVLTALATAVQVTWAAPVLESAAGWNVSALVYVSVLCLVAGAATLAALALCPRRHGAAARTRWVVLTMVAYWVLANWIDFSVRVAAWSTFETSSIALHVLRASALPVAACAVALALLLPRALVRR
ncbi:uncharacterized membrane protein YhaH (DUF805 family) [Luteimonas sp. 3794]|nr:uncharacterized membrane protein YhaH (DUF805 family) [Luteimonas sp. 3794]